MACFSLPDQICPKRKYGFLVFSEAVEIKLLKLVAGSPGLVVMGGDSRPEGHEFESQHRIQDGIFHIDLL